MRIVHVESAPTESRVKVHFDSGKEMELWLEANVDLDTKADCWLFLLLPICMGLGEDLEIVGTLSKTAVNAFNNAQRELLEEHPNLQAISLKHDSPLLETVDYSNKRGIGSFFSGGLDSTYSAETEPEIDTLIGVWGFDVQVWNQKHWKLAGPLLEEHAAAMGKKLILVKTNIREISNGLLLWGRDYHGTALAGVANALANHLQKVYLSATHAREYKRWGHFPSLAKAFCTDYQQISEHGPEVRTAKALALANSPRTKHIRVCYRNVTGKANCGICKKCLRTRLEFDMINAQYRPLGLEKRPTIWELLTVKVDKSDYQFFLDAIGWAKDNGYRNTRIPLAAISTARLNSRLYFRIQKLKKPKK